MKLIDSIVDFMTDDAMQDEHMRKYGRLWGSLFVLLGVMLFIVAGLVAIFPEALGQLRIPFTLIFSLTGMLMILIGERIYKNRTTSY